MNRTYLFDCKHKHMMKSGAPPDKSPPVSCTVWLPIEFHGFTSRINYKGYHSWFLVLSQFFGDGMGPFNILSFHTCRNPQTLVGLFM